MSWLADRTPRERILLTVALPVAAVALAWTWIAAPLLAARVAQTEEIAAYRLVAETATLARTVEFAPAPAPLDPLAARVTRSAAAASLTLRRIEPEGEGLRVTLTDARFDDVLVWLADLEVEALAAVAAIEIERRPEPGFVSGRILFEELAQ